MTDITPPPELVQQWASTKDYDIAPWWVLNDVAASAAAWGANQELEACCEWLKRKGWEYCPDPLRAARRPKQPSLKEQAIEMLENTWKGGHISNNAAQTIRRALEALPDD
jgi:hypothetical protein